LSRDLHSGWVQAAAVDAPPAASGLPGLRGRLLARNAGFNLVGQVVPLLAALALIPLLLASLGTVRFGLLTIVWVFIGYFSLFDFGLGRALTKLVAERVGRPGAADLPGLVGTALGLMAALGAVGGLALAAAAPHLAGPLLGVPAEMQAEVLHSLYLLAAGVPVVILSVGCRGVLEAHQWFGWVNAVRIPLGVSMFAAPLLALAISPTLWAAVAALVMVRLAGLAAFALLCWRKVPQLKGGLRLGRAWLRPLVAFGGWMTVSNIVSPLMMYIDRVLLAAWLTAAVVAFYTTPFEVMVRLLIIPGAVSAVLFPAFSSALAADRERAQALYAGACRWIAVFLLPATLACAAFAHEGLGWWLGPEFARQSTPVMQWLAVGVLFNGLAFIPFVFVQGAGRPRITAQFHLLELPIYLGLLWLLVGRFGLAGAAMAWALRVALDAVLLSGAAGYLQGGMARALLSLARVTLPGLALLGAAVASEQLWHKIAVLAAGLLLSALWAGVLTAPGRWTLPAERR
jgi:O-antigen/teichoic acid export membrane protein